MVRLLVASNTEVKAKVNAKDNHVMTSVHLAAAGFPIHVLGSSRSTYFHPRIDCGRIKVGLYFSPPLLMPREYPLAR